MSQPELWQRFQVLRVWANGTHRAPHKPLLALWAIGRCLRGADRMAPFALVDAELGSLLGRFGPHRQVVHTEFPFWRMQKDEIWELDRPHLVTTTRKGDAHKTDLLNHDIRGGLSLDAYNAFRNDPDFAWRVAESLVEAHFPNTLQDQVLRATGVEGGPINDMDDTKSPSNILEIRDTDDFVTSRRRKRNSAFRGAVLEAYGHQCAVCRFAVRMEGQPLALDAAHIRWHEASGPAQVRNGMALCTLHHRLFDEGAFTVLEKRTKFEVLITDMADGLGFNESLKQFQGTFLHIPNRLVEQPEPNFLKWHRREVFRSSVSIP